MEINDTENKLNAIEKELIKIFNIVTSEEKISGYKSYLLNSKISILFDVLDKLGFSLLKTSIINPANALRFNRKVIILLVFSYIVLLFNPYIGIIINMLGWYLKVKANKKMAKVVEELKYLESLKDKVNGLERLMTNCHRLLNSRTDDEMEASEEELKDIDLKRIYLANEVIEVALHTGTEENIPDDLKELMIKILQADLQTTETDLKMLIQMALEKNMQESLQNFNEEAKIRTKKDEK